MTLPERGITCAFGQAVTAHGGYFKGRAGLHFALRAVPASAIAEGREVFWSLCNKEYSLKAIPENEN